MDEHRAAAAGDSRARVVVDLDDEVVESVGAGEAVGRAPGRHLHRPIVMAVRRVLAPTVVEANPLHRQCGSRTAVALAAPPEPFRAEDTPRSTTIPLAFVGLDAAAPERHG